MDKKFDFKKLLLLISPLLSFFVLFIPYKHVNQSFIVKLFGCGCPKIDEYGNMTTSHFNANDFTALFWGAIAICVTVAAVLLSRKIPKEKLWLKILYIIGMFAASLLIAYRFFCLMMWC